MTLTALLEKLSGIQCDGKIDAVDVKSISCDSREDQRGALFVALGGFKFKGANFVSDVIAKGAVAIVIAHNEMLSQVPAHVVIIRTQDPKAMLRTLALRFYGNPSQYVKTVGITGTNGKTTFTYLLESIIHAANQTCGVIGTVNYRIGQEIVPAKNTTPGFIDMQRFLGLLKTRHAQYCVMEVSSHALHQGRVDGIDFSAAVFSNLTQDHLDYHQTMEAYFQAKALLFKRQVPAVINVDDRYGKRLCQMAQGKVITYGIDSDADIKAVNIKYDLSGTTFDIKDKVSIKTALIGKHNVYNILSAITCAHVLGFGFDVIKKGVEALTNVPGRLEAVRTGKDFYVFIDYAHTEDGLVNVLKSLRTVSQNKIITVFGCGGDRDNTKRPKMGAAVCVLSDHAIITSDNPRSEDPSVIIDQIVKGFTKKNYEVCVDRKEAIGRALKQAKAGAIVLLAGKGHEDYQILKDRTIKFNEHAIVKELIGV